MENERQKRGDRADRKPQDEFIEKLVKLNRTSKTVKGGRRMAFSALTVVGDQKGRIGFGFGKANDVTEAIRKSLEKARANLTTLPMKNGTIPHEIIGKYKSSSVLLKPACPGTGIIAGGAVRAVMDAAGITDVISKSQGSRTSVNVVRATFNAVAGLMDARAVAQARGKALKDMWG
jgi:small subunit ribosomal protein S5